MKMTAMLGNLRRLMLLGLVLAIPPQLAQAQEWGAVPYFQYNIDDVIVAPVSAGTWKVRVVFSVIDRTDPSGNTAWNLKSTTGPFVSPAAVTADIGWDPAGDFTNTGSAGVSLSPVPASTLGPGAPGAAIPVQARSLAGSAGAAVPCTTAACPNTYPLTNRYYVERTVTPVAFTSAVTHGRVALEGKPVCNGIPGYTCATPMAAIPVPSATANFKFEATTPYTAMIADPRRPIVDINKCFQCHDGKQHGDVIVPKLSLHGNNRTENLGLCVVCHNPNQTDVPYRYQTAGTTADPRIAGPEVPIDFKVMVHAIHSGGFRVKPYVVVGFGSSVNDFSDVRFPRELRKSCPDCHIDANGKGTFELPIKTTLGTTVNTQSTYLVAPGATRSINVNPFDDLKMTPTAATCSACHDKAEVRSHMVKEGGASFSTAQANIGTTFKEKCFNCHGPGKDKDVRKMHEIGR